MVLERDCGAVVGEPFEEAGVVVEDERVRAFLCAPVEDELDNVLGLQAKGDPVVIIAVTRGVPLDTLDQLLVGGADDCADCLDVVLAFVLQVAQERIDVCLCS